MSDDKRENTLDTSTAWIEDKINQIQATHDSGSFLMADVRWLMAMLRTVCAERDALLRETKPNK